MYVDDILLIAVIEKELIILKEIFARKIVKKDMGNLKYVSFVIKIKFYYLKEVCF